MEHGRIAKRKRELYQRERLHGSNCQDSSHYRQSSAGADNFRQYGSMRQLDG